MPYFITFALSTFFAYRAHKAKSREMVIFYSLLAVLLPSLLGGLRHYTIGNDTKGYALYHHNSAVSASSFGEFLLCDRRLSRELGWTVLTYVSSKIFDNFNCNLFIYETITIVCSYVALYRHRKSVPLHFSWLIWLLVIYNTTYCFIRQGIAASIIFLGFSALENKKYTNFFLYVVVAILFHSSALIVVTYFMGTYYYIQAINFPERANTLKKRIMFYSPLFLLLFVRYFMVLIVSLVPFLATYMGYWNSVSGSMYGKIAFLTGDIIMFLLYPKGLHRVFCEGDMDKFWKFNVILNLIYRLAIQIMSVRVLFYFDFINPMLLASLPFLVKEKYLRIIVIFAVFSISLLYFVLCYVTIGRAGYGTWPYRTIFD